MSRTWITVLGATGSIGVSTLDVIARHAERYAVYALTGFSRMRELEGQCLAHSPLFAVVADEKQAGALQQSLRQAGSATEVLWGEGALEQVARDTQVDVVMAAIVGAAGLRPTLAAVQAGKRVLLANKARSLCVRCATPVQCYCLSTANTTRYFNACRLIIRAGWARQGCGGFC